MFNFLLQQMYCDREGNGQKPTRTKPPGQKPPRVIEIEFIQGTFFRDFCTRPTKKWGGPRCVTYFHAGLSHIFHFVMLQPLHIQPAASIWFEVCGVVNPVAEIFGTS